MLLMEKENLVEKEAVMFVSGSKKVTGLLKITTPALVEGTSSSLVRPITPFRMYESPRRLRFRREKEGKLKLTFSADANVSFDELKRKTKREENKKTRSFLGGVFIVEYIAREVKDAE